MKREDLVAYFEALFSASLVKDYCPNGLQVEGAEHIRHIVCGVTASQALIDVAIARGADTILVHHGYFWRGEDPRVVATRRARLKKLLMHDINLFAYHLPLDLHPEFGNNTQWARVMGWRISGSCGEQSLVALGAPEAPETAEQVARSIAARTGREPMIIGDAGRIVRRVAWCTGAAQSMFELAIDAGADLYVSGEISEPTVHLARESGIPYIAAGHHVTERYGIHALGAHVADKLGLCCDFVDIDNPV